MSTMPRKKTSKNGEIDVKMLAIGNNELVDRQKVGRMAICPRCKKKHIIKFGKDTKSGKVSKFLGFVECGEDVYLVSIEGKLL